MARKRRRHFGCMDAAARQATVGAWLAVLLFAAILLGLGPLAAGATRTWIGGSDNWNVAGNWSPTGQPLAGEDVFLTETDSIDRTVGYYNTTNPNSTFKSLKIDATGAGTMTLDLSSGHTLKVTTEYVGYDGQGAVTQSAGTVTAATLYLGYDATGTGTYTMTGGTLTSATAQYVGYSGTGTLNIRNGSQVTSSVATSVGKNGGSSGTATVDGSASKWTNAATLYVGDSGTGTLNIQNGSQVTNTTGYAGNASGSHGTVTVDGSGSKWGNSANLYVGYAGTGTLTVQNGGLVTNSLNATVAESIGSSGTVTVDGSGSKWTNSADLWLADHGQGALTIRSGAQVSNKVAYLGGATGGSATVTVTGNGSTWANSQLYAGYLSSATVTIQDGGQVSGEGHIAENAGSHGTVTVDGSGSAWTNSGDLCVARLGTAALNVQNGGQVSGVKGYLGYLSGSSGTVTVDGIGSKWTCSSNLYVGNSGTGTLRIQNGGQVVSNSQDAFLAATSGSNGSVTVDGGGSTWTASSLFIGYVGTGTLSIQNGGQLTSSRAWVGGSNGGNGTATVDGSGSAWTNGDDLRVGLSGTGALTVGNGGQVTTSGLFQVTATGSASLGSDSRLAAGEEDLSGHVLQTGGTNGAAYVSVSSSYQLHGGTLQVNGGGLDVSGTLDFGTPGASPTVHISATDALINLARPGSSVVGAKAATLDITGPNSLLILPASLTPASFGGYSNAGMLHTAGSPLALAPNQSLTVWGHIDDHVDCQGALTASAGGFVSLSGGLSVSGTGAVDLGGGGDLSEGVLYVNDTTSGVSGGSLKAVGLQVGTRAGAVGALTIQNGGRAYSTARFDCYVGYAAGASGTVTVDGPGSQWTDIPYLYIGYSGTGTLNIQNGGQVVSNAYCYIGDKSGSKGTATVDGGGSTLTGSTYLYVGYSGTGTLNVRNGGQVSGTAGYVGNSSGSNGTVTVDGIGSKWNSSALYMGISGTGTLNVQNGGQVSDVSGYLGASGSATSTATVDGGGSAWANSSSLYVGNSGSGTLYVQNGGQVSSTSLYVGNSGSGMLYVQNGGQVSCTDGYLGYSGSSSGGTVTVTGSGSTWAGSGALYVGYAGKGTVSIRNGGAVANTSGYLGYSSGSSGTVTVDGSGSAWTCSGDLYVGGSSSGAGGTGAITVQNGGQVTVGGTLQVRSGANTVTLNSGGQLAANVETVYGTVIQTGGTNTTSLSVPSGGTYKLYSGTLQITGGLDLAGTLDFGTPGGSPVAYLNAPSGIINLAETGSSVLGAKAAALDVGASAILILPASLAPTDFGAYANAGLLFAQGSTLTVGPGQGFTGLGNLLGHIDSQGTLTAIPGQYINVTGGAMVSGGGAVDLGYGRLIVTDIVSGVSGGSLKCGEVDVSYASGSIGTAVVEGSGSTVTCSGWLNTGGAGTGALTIRSGAQVSSVLGSIGGGSGPGGTVTVDGSGSVWANSGALYVGSTGGTGTLTVQNGGHVSSATGFIAYQNIGTLPSGTVIVDGNGSTWTNSGDLYVGRDGPGILTIRNGGYVCNAQAYIAYIGSSSGSVTVDGAGSTWVNTSSLNFGGVTGTLTIQNGGHVSSADGYIGALFGNSNGTVVVDGAGSLWNDSGSLYLAGSATQHVGTGSVTVQNGGGLTVAGTIRIWSKGTLAIQSGGSVTAGDLDKKTGGTITWTDGTLGITGASGLTIGSTGPLGSALTLDAGKTLNVTNTATIASGASVSLSGGSLTAGALANAGSFNWTTGTLGITGTSGLVIDAGGPLGASVTLGEGKTLNVTNTATVAAGASLTVDGGSFSAGNLANLGTLLVRAADTTVFTSAIENSANVEFAVASGTGIFGQYLGGSGTFTKSGAGTLLVAGPQDYEPGATFSVLDGTLRLDSDTGAGGANLSISVTDAEVHFGCDQELDTLIIGDGGKVVFADAHVVVLDDLVISGFDFGAMTLTPEPATVALLALGGVGVWVRRRQK